LGPAMSKVKITKDTADVSAKGKSRVPFMGDYGETTFIRDQNTKAVQYRCEVLDGEIYELVIAQVNMDTNKRHEFVWVMTASEAAGFARLMNRTVEKGLTKE
jgi:hypothetical protein